MREGRRWRLRRGLLRGALLLAAPLLGCDAEHQYLIWPTAAYTGDTVAILFNSECDTLYAPEAALLDASVGNILIQVSDSTDWTESITPRLIIEAPVALGSHAVGQEFESFTGLVAIFDLPDPWPNGSLSFPDEFTVEVEYKGSATFGVNQLTVLGSGGSPIEFSSATPAERLELGPMLRLRPAWDSASGEGFDPGWEIGGLELTLRYSPGAGEVTQVHALGNGEAAAGLAMATELAPEGSDKLWRIVLLDPPGFALPERGCNGGGECFSGRWSLLDLPLEVDTTGLLDGEVAFVPEDFAIEDLQVVDPDGMQLNPAYAGETFFHVYAANNVVPLPEPGMLLLLAAGVLGLGVLHRLDGRRRRAGAGTRGRGLGIVLLLTVLLPLGGVRARAEPEEASHCSLPPEARRAAREVYEAQLRLRAAVQDPRRDALLAEIRRAKELVPSALGSRGGQPRGLPPKLEAQKARIESLLEELRAAYAGQPERLAELDRVGGGLQRMFDECESIAGLPDGPRRRAKRKRLLQELDLPQAARGPRRPDPMRSRPARGPLAGGTEPIVVVPLPPQRGGAKP